jgi:hypothetical protein
LIFIFGLDFTAEVVPRPPISKIPVSDLWRLEDSVNVISIKVAESDVGYPINVYGTVLARDEYDYSLQMYLFIQAWQGQSPTHHITGVYPFIPPSCY